MSPVPNLPSFMQPSIMLVVTEKSGMIIRDQARSQSQGAKEVRRVPVGTELFCYYKIFVENVPYGRLVAADPNAKEWIRISEAGGASPYVDEFPMVSTPTSDGAMVGAVVRVAAALENLVGAVQALAIRK